MVLIKLLFFSISPKWIWTAQSRPLRIRLMLMSASTGDGFKVASIFSRWVMCGAQECVQSSPHHEVNLLFPEQWQKGHLFSFINACVVVDFCCVLLILLLMVYGESTVWCRLHIYITAVCQWRDTHFLFVKLN